MVTTNDLSFSYKRSKQLLQNINLHLPKGSIYGVFGKNGVGKSTLLKLISGLIFPNKGSISVMGYSPRERAVPLLENLYYIPEKMPTTKLSIRQYEKGYAPFYPHFDHEQFVGYLRDFDMTDLSQKLHKCSYGQLKKFYISFAIATNASILLMDEPTNGLDIPSKATFRKIVASVADEKRCFVISTHQVADLNNLIDSVLIMKNNKIILNESIEHLSQQLFFGLKNEVAHPSEIAYTEPNVRGDMVVAKAQEERCSNVDIELLFNALDSQEEKVIQLLTNPIK